MKRIDVYTKTYMDDGLGGQAFSYILYETYYGTVGVLSGKVGYDEYGRNVTDTIQLYILSNETFNGEYYFEVDNQFYEVIDTIKYNRKTVLTGQVVHR